MMAIEDVRYRSLGSAVEEPRRHQFPVHGTAPSGTVCLPLTRNSREAERIRLTPLRSAA